MDEDLLAAARRARAGFDDGALLDAALESLLARDRRAELDASCEAYDDVPLDRPDGWGDLASFREAAARS